PGAAAGDPMDRAAGAEPGVVPRLHGRLLGADVDLACHGSARADPAQDQARRSRPCRPLSKWGHELLQRFEAAPILLQLLPVPASESCDCGSGPGRAPSAAYPRLIL